MLSRTFERFDLETFETEVHELPDGRALAYMRFGAAGGRPLYYFHGCPGSRIEAAPAGRWAARAGYEVFAFDRPGCGRSTPSSGYRMLDWARDVAAFADAREHARFGIIGLSGGGAYVDTCAYALPKRLLFAYDLAGWGPVAQYPELQAHLAPLDRFFLKRASSIDSLFRVPFSLLGFGARHLGDRGFARAIRSSMGEDDRELILGNENVRRFLRAVVKESFAQGSRGPADDAIRCYGHWGFDLRDVDFPLRIWHGTDDQFASFELARFKHEAIGRSTLTILEGRGHLHLATVYGKIFEDIEKHA